MENTVTSVEDPYPAREPGPEEMWTENYLYHAYDPDSRFGFWFHLGTVERHFDLWQDIVITYLPDGSYLVARGYGKRHRTDGPAGPMLAITYDEEHDRWSLDFEGMAQRCTQDELFSGVISERLHEPFSLHLETSPLTTIWDVTDTMKEQTWAHAHWEQNLTYEGWVEFDGTRTPFTGTGFRDHSRGARDLDKFGYHHWLHGEFPSGKAFGVLKVVSPRVPVLFDRAYIYDGTTMHEAKCIEIPPLVPDPADLKPFEEPFEFRLVIDAVLEEAKLAGREIGPDEGERISGQIFHDFPFTFGYPNEFFFGGDTSTPGVIMCEGQTKFSWDGETGFGLTERTVDFHDPDRPRNSSLHND